MPHLKIYISQAEKQGRTHKKNISSTAQPQKETIIAADHQPIPQTISNTERVAGEHQTIDHAIHNSSFGEEKIKQMTAAYGQSNSPRDVGEEWDV